MNQQGELYQKPVARFSLHPFVSIICVRFNGYNLSLSFSGQSTPGDPGAKVEINWKARDWKVDLTD